LNAREEILNAADKLFGKAGFDAATTREIAEMSGVNKALIHYHFKSKEALYVAVIDRYYQQLNETFQTILIKDCDIREKFILLIDNYVDFLAKNMNFSRIVQRESSGGKHVERISKHLVPMFQVVANILEDAFPEARSEDMASHHILVSFYGIIITYFTYGGVIERILGKDPFCREELEARRQHLHKMLDIILEGIKRENYGER